jgi:SSS family solute:Na+ symporter
VNLPWSDTTKVYIAILAFALNVIVAVVLTVILRAAGVPDGTDQTRPSDYTADVGDAGVQAELDPEGATH